MGIFKKRISQQRGISLIEILMTVAILSTGIVMIYKSFFLSMDYLDHLSIRVHANLLLNNKIAELRKNFVEEGELFIRKTEQKNVMIHNRVVPFNFVVGLNEFKGLRLYQVDINLTWPDRHKMAGIRRSVYLTTF